jgi:streptogramin lyase
VRRTRPPLAVEGLESRRLLTVTITEFPVPTANSFPLGITTGPDGNLWFTEQFVGKVGMINPTTHAIAEFLSPTVASQPTAITAGPDGNLWFTDQGGLSGGLIGMINPTTHAIAEFLTPASRSLPGGITTGPDGNLWFIENGANQVGMINPTTHAIAEFPIPTANSDPFGITTGSDGNLWFTEGAASANKIGMINPTTHAFAEFPVPTANSTPIDITTGPDGNLWFTESTGNKIGTMNPRTHAITEFTIPTANSVPVGITTGPDGNLWFTENAGDKIGLINPTTHAFAEFPVPNTSPTGGSLNLDLGITTGPDHNIWFPVPAASAIAQAVISAPSTVTVTGIPIAQVENAPFSGPVATFTPFFGSVAPAYSATIDWGDGTAPTAGTVTPGTNGQFVVNGTHTYTEEGHYPVKITVSFFNGSTTQVVGTGTTTATISEDFVVTNTNDSGPGSLRDLIDDLNGDGFGGTIVFHIPGPGPHVIHLLSPLSPVYEPVIIDGSTEPGFAGRPLVVLDGSAVPSGDGLDLYAAGSGVESLAIGGFRGGVGVVLQGPGVRFVESCYIGTDPTGTLPAPNYQGVLILGSSGNIVVANVISGNLSVGVQVFDNLNVTDPGQVWALPPAHASGNQIIDNFIGTDASGTLPLPNQQGVYINDAAGNLVSGNVVAANRSIGVQVLGEAATGNVVMNNWIGTDMTATRPLGNGLGVFVYAAPGNAVAANVLGFNPQGGVVVRPLSDGPEVQSVTFTRDAAGNLTGASILFTTYLDRARAQNPANYRVALLGANLAFLGTVPLGAPVYNAIQRSAFVPFARPVPAGTTIQLRVSGRGAGAITDRVGNPLAGISSPRIPGGSDFVATYRNGIASGGAAPRA